MKRSILILALGALVAGACSPQTFTLSVDMRHPSKAGVDLGRKSMSIVYMDNGTADSTFSNHVASSLARSLEAEYFGGEEAIGVYKVPEDSVSLDLMHRLVMDTGDDVVFLLGPPTFGEVALAGKQPVEKATSVDSAFVVQAQIPYNARIFVYDSMGKEDQMYVFRGSSILRSSFYDNGTTADEFLLKRASEEKLSGADYVGTQVSNRFAPTWKTENYTLYYFEGFNSDEWVRAIGYAYETRWNKAADIWMRLVKTGNRDKCACACYNLAVAFYMMGDLNLATKWLDHADQYASLALSPGLRKRIEERK